MIKEEIHSVSKKSKVVLYNPLAPYFDMPLALLAVGSFLQYHGFHVVIIDARVDAQAEAHLLEHASGAVCVGMSVLTGAPIRDALQTAAACKQRHPEVPIVWGGWHPSLFPTEILEQEPDIDITVQGQGEWSILEIVQCLYSRKPLDDVRGICFRQGDRIIKNPTRPLGNINHLPRIDYSLIDVERYFLKKGKRQFDYVASIGCRGRCAFCADPFIYRSLSSTFMSSRIISDLHHYHARYAFTEVNFQDDTFFTSRTKTLALANGFIKAGVRFNWAAAMRADQDAKLTADDFKLLRESGANRLLIGVESGSQKMLERIEKGMTLQQIFSCAEKCKSAGLQATFPFIVGFPGETDEDLKATTHVIKALGAKSPLFEIRVFFFKPYPGSKIHEGLVQETNQKHKSVREWATFDFDVCEEFLTNKKHFRFFTNLEFYLKLAYRKSNPFLFPLKQIARLRCRWDIYIFPIERKIHQLLHSWKLKNVT
jgi:radical SAM superfamily enzyme YgiQ (UPF0313 family)